MTGGGRADKEVRGGAAGAGPGGYPGHGSPLTRAPTTPASSAPRRTSSSRRSASAWQGWAPDFPLPYGYWKSIADGGQILPEGNYNTPSLNDPKVNSLIAQALSAPAAQQGAIEQQIDDEVMANAVYLPYNFQKALFFRSPKLTNVSMLKGVGEYYDIVNMGKSS